ncbi:xanthine dehydrogenase family protein molybdopterin-binding subunit [Streptomyces sp. NPDC051776]|uniref:xanthine dehydrogenase family protein molybdopterin-binding subunit n=1 Tax=Streptomyces sp. NPDC051776 TaxID=3155414 RepID=UPI0034386ACB
MTTMEAPKKQEVGAVGLGVDRVDGPLKVTGAAPYPSDIGFPHLAHAVLVRTTVAAGRISVVDTSEAEAAPGVLAVITHLNAPRLARGARTILGPEPPPPLQDDRVLHYGQYAAVVVAETFEQATAAARLVHLSYDPGDPLLDPEDPRVVPKSNPFLLDMKRGSVTDGLEQAEVRLKATYVTAENTNNPLGAFATVAAWDGDRLTVHDATQWPYNVRNCLAAAFRISKDQVRVLAPYVGGGFGAGLRTWPHVILAALAARRVRRPVKLVLTRPQMFTGVGHRPSTVQHVKLGALRNGRLTAIDHEAVSTAAMEDSNMESVTMGTAAAYACPNMATRDKQIKLNIPSPGSMRAPGEAQGNFALESALDELAYELDMDPLDLRMRNYADFQPQTGLAWSSKALRECYQAGAERFGWRARDPRPGSMRDGHVLIGYGMAGVSYPHYQSKCAARATIARDGTAYVRSAATDIGTGTYTVMAQLSAELLGLTMDQVRFQLGDSDMPQAPQAGGSGLTAALGTAVHDACGRLVSAFLDLARKDDESPLRGCRLEDVVVAGGRILRASDPSRGEAYTDILARHGLSELTSDGNSAFPKADIGQLVGSLAVSRLGRLGSFAVKATRATVPAGAFGAKFVEVRVDRDLGHVRVTRVVSAIDGGRILNAKTARSQIIGGTVGGIGQALFEDTLTDMGTGRIANATFGDYLVPVNADVPEMDVLFVGGPDPATPVGTKGIGEIGLVGVGAAVANAVHHATGRRIRRLPITLDQLL